MPVQHAWRVAYATQSASDLDVYKRLCKQPGLSVCHRLHYLQMHLEKLAKAWLWRSESNVAQAMDVRSTHNVIAKVLPMLIREYWRRVGFAGNVDGARLRRIRELCREIDLLAPAIADDGRRPDNSEYPWAAVRNGTSVVLIPCKEPFQIAERLRSTDGKQILKIASYACQELTR
jgi:hypothetical protein